ncbi:hypothetical protein ASE74_24145 [Pedobacter sp. Leaf216]|uniref:type II toxin-antitoxin system HicA family toxin n=1 Tax=Pedobacter sp. Leaf216 TaxID=1735684 RepID=UPI0006F5BFDF|nr:type II toxin-antitoxin system HicA family toxin [Pedobacter sp. Leaf216]KQM68211.1 hypothetical protein ASE74_24145 [Pedobacter sp. Leaf216]
MKWNELIKKLKKAGWHKLRDAKGSHEIWQNAEGDKHVVIAFHGAKEIGPGLASSILKQAGLK